MNPSDAADSLVKSFFPFPPFFFAEYKKDQKYLCANLSFTLMLVSKSNLSLHIFFIIKKANFVEIHCQLCG